MRSTIVPAQITTVEDTVAGNLSVVQLILLCAPLFAGGAIFVLLPPFFIGSAYKITLVAVIAAIFWVMAIRIKDRLVLEWTITIGRYNLRPRRYLFNKNDAYLRTDMAVQPAQIIQDTASETTQRVALRRKEALRVRTYEVR
jgi:hypothetical protein